VPFSRAGIGPVISITSDGRRVNFPSEPLGDSVRQIWVGDRNPPTLGTAPEVSDISFAPNFVLADGLSASTFRARVTGGQGAIARVCANSFNAGQYQPGISSILYDDGTHGDASAGDRLYANDAVRSAPGTMAIAEPLTIRTFAATSRQVTAVDTAPFFILSEAP
jgi:hypothetical protein